VRHPASRRNDEAPVYVPGLQASQGSPPLLVPAFIVPIDAVRIDPVEHFYPVTCPLSHLRAGSASIEPPRDPGMPEVIRPADKRRCNDSRKKRRRPGLPQHVPESGRLINAAAVSPDVMLLLVT
jgi:hypothetical protein